MTTNEAVNIFRFDGQDWTVAYEGRRFTLIDRLGCFYIASLLREPDQKFTATELREANNRFRVAPGNFRNSSGGEEILQTCLESGAKDLGEVIDEVGYGAVRSKIREIDQDLETAERHGNNLDVERLGGERQVLADYLFHSYQPGGKQRKMAVQQKVNRDAVCNAINRTLGIVFKKSPALHKHLNNSLKRGPICSYEPEKPTDWDS